jgi:hypothetical protein
MLVLFYQNARHHLQGYSNVDEEHITSHKVQEVSFALNFSFIYSSNKDVCYVKLQYVCLSSVWKAYSYTGQCIS